MTYEGARTAIITYLSAALASAYPTMEVFYENTTEIDLTKAADRFLIVDISFDTAKQVSIEATPMNRVLGSVVFRVMVKKGRGTVKALQLFDYLTSITRQKQLGGLSLKVPTPGKKATPSGWASFDLFVPFQFDSLP